MVTYHGFRQAHFLGHNKTTSIPQNLLFFDCEANVSQSMYDAKEEIHSLRLGVAIHVCSQSGRKAVTSVRDFRCPEQFWNFLDNVRRPRKTIYAFAHNIGYDLRLLDFWRAIEDGGYQRGVTVLKSPPFILQLKSKKGSVVFLDSMNFFRCSLAKAGNSIGLNKFPMPFFDLSDDIWFRYCKRDVEVLAKLVTDYLDWIKGNDLGRFKYTVAGQSFAAFKHRFNTHRILIHGNRIATALERDSYRGARATAFYIGLYGGKTYNVDVRSLFPSVMLSGQFPIRATSHEVMPLPSKWRKFADDGKAIARVKLKTLLHQYPVKRSEGIVYPVGTYTTILAGPELQRAYRACEILFCGELITYDTAAIFTEHVKHFTGQRGSYLDHGNAVWGDLCKQFCCALYGKFGQRSYEWRSAPGAFTASDSKVWSECDYETGVVKTIRRLFEQPEESIKEEESYDSWPAIPAFVTSYARIVMDNYRAIAGPKNVLLQYVDSLIVTQDGMDNLAPYLERSHYDLGKLRIVDESDGCTIINANHVVWNARHKASGIPRSAEWRSGNRARYTSWESLPETLGRGSGGTVRTRKVSVTTEGGPPGCGGTSGEWVDPPAEIEQENSPESEESA